MELTTVEAVTQATFDEEVKKLELQGWKEASPPVKVGLRIMKTMFREVKVDDRIANDEGDNVILGLPDTTEEREVGLLP